MTRLVLKFRYSILTSISIFEISTTKSQHPVIVAWCYVAESLEVGFALASTLLVTCCLLSFSAEGKAVNYKAPLAI